MKQFTFEYSNQPQLIANLNSVSSWAKKKKVENIWIQVYVMDESGDSIRPIEDAICLSIPYAKYVITHAGMAFGSGLINETSAVVVCNLFEDPETRVELCQYPFSPDDFEKTTDEIIAYINSNPWIKMISFNCGASLGGIRCLNRMAASVDPDIVMSGGAAATATMSVPAQVLSSGGPMSTECIVMTCIGGKNFHARADVVVGWKGIGKEFTVTRSDGSTIFEMDNEPAFNVYRKYLKIETDPGLVVGQTIEFPLCFKEEDILFLRCPFILNPDGSMTMMLNDLHEGRKLRLSFGSPDVILDELANKLNEIAEFEPQVINVNSCLGRSFFWGKNIGNELSMFEKIAATGGYLTGGEILRKGDRMLIFNETIIITGMREGDLSKNGSRVRTVGRNTKDYSLTQRLATFIDTITHDLEEYNDAIKQMAIVDGLTGLFNRRELERRIDMINDEGKNFTLLMIDADNFKHINDNYGHSEGDRVLCLLSRTIEDVIKDSGLDACAGRWGGDEFMILFSGEGKEKVVAFARELQSRFHSDTAYKDFLRTISIGIASTDSDVDASAIYHKVDERLYKAKASGKGSIVS